MSARTSFDKAGAAVIVSPLPLVLSVSMEDFAMFSDDARPAAWDAEVHAPGGGRYALRPRRPSFALAGALICRLGRCRLVREAPRRDALHRSFDTAVSHV